MNTKPTNSLLAALCAAVLVVSLGTGLATPATAAITSGVLDPIQLDTDGHDARAKFTPIEAGTETKLQVKLIKDGSWKTISTDKQRASGYTYFQISDPLEV